MRRPSGATIHGKTTPHANPRRSLLKSALNLDLTLSDYGKCPGLLISSGIIDLGAFCVELQHLQIQGCHFLKSALNLDLTLSDYGKCPALLESSGIIDLGAFCVELWPSQVSYRISVPM